MQEKNALDLNFARVHIYDISDAMWKGVQQQTNAKIIKYAYTLVWGNIFFKTSMEE